MVILASRIHALIVIHDVMIRELVVLEQRWNRDLTMYLYVMSMRCPHPTSREETRDKGRAAAGALPCPGKGEPATPSRGKLLQCTGAPSRPFEGQFICPAALFYLLIHPRRRIITTTTDCIDIIASTAMR